MESPVELFEDVITSVELSVSQPMEGVFHSHLDERVRPYIDLIDSLRVMGIERDLALPSIAVIGDQSSGKSSVLEALSGVALPRGSGIVTRCPLELRLRKLTRGVSWKAVISYGEAIISFDDPSQVEGHVTHAQNTLAGDGVGICDELITLEISSPDVCDLTLIDLPGIARVPVKGQPEDIGEQIKSLIMNFIEKTETIILVVVPCNVDIATTEALKMAQIVDPEGKRTLAILTKPDLIDKGTEKNVLDIVRNQVIPLSKGYIIVKCRGQQQIDDKVSLPEATRTERDFFKYHEYFSGLLHEEKATTQCLATKLTNHLVDHIKKSLPFMSEQIKKQLWEAKKELSQFQKGPPVDPHERRSFLIDTLTEFNDKINCLANGQVVIQENLFNLLRTEFEKWKKILDDSKDTYHKTVQEVVSEFDDKHRGRELPGFNSFTVFLIVVQKLVVELKAPAIDTMKSIRDMIQGQFTEVAKTSFMGFPYLQRVSMNKIDNIQSTQEALVKERIVEHFKMEQLVYTQDGIYWNALKGKTTLKEIADEENGAKIDSRSNYPEMLKAYYDIVTQRLADQVPMLIQFFLLKESARMLCRDILNLMDEVNVNEILSEETEVSRRRIDMQKRIERLMLAQKKISSSC